MTKTEPNLQRFRDLMPDSEPGFEDVMVCVFDIQHHETRTYQTLLDSLKSTVEYLADQLDRDRSNVNRSLPTLREKDLTEHARIGDFGEGKPFRCHPLAKRRNGTH